MKKFIISIIIVVLAIAIFLGLNFKSTIDNPLTLESTEEIIVEKGESFYNVLEDLKVEGKIKNTNYIKIYTRLANKNLDILPGTYELSSDMSLDDIIDIMVKGNNIYGSINIVIPEDYSIDDIGEKLEKEGISTKAEFIQAVNEYPLPHYVKDNNDKRYNLEGYLFPDTYNFNEGVEPEQIISVMIARFEEVWFEILGESTNDITNDDIEAIITIASMIEKEAVVDEDRALISSVIQNRLEIDMPLQIDATVIYAHGYHLDPVLYKHLEIDSPYNTYEYYGLPVGPICSPGLKSIEAALNPELTDYLFYLVESNSKHYFTDNYDDFLEKKLEFGY